MTLSQTLIAVLSLSTLTLVGCQNGDGGMPENNDAHEARKTDATPKPLYALAWSSMQTSSDNTDDKTSEKAQQPAWIVPFFWLRNDATPEQAKAFLDQQPAGARCMIWVWDGIGGDPMQNKADLLDTPDGARVRGLWMDHGIQQTSQAMRDFFRRFKAIGGQVDYLVMDHEYGFTRWHPDMTEQAFKAIENDPRFQSEGWPEKLGFSDLPKELVQTPYPTENQVRWNLLMRSHTATILNQSIYEPVREFFPDIKVSNYGNAYSVGIPDCNGHIHQITETPWRLHVGSDQSAETYGRIKPGLQKKKFDGQRPFGASPFKSFLLGVNSARAMASHDSVSFMPWIAFLAFDREGCFYGQTDYYQELVLHVAMANPDVLLYWNPRPWKPEHDPSTLTTNAQDELVSRLLTQFNTQAGYADRKPLSIELVDWYASYVLSGMTVNHQTLWRFTPELNLEAGEQADSTIVSRKPLVFRIKGITVKFPHGSLLDTGGEDAPLGFWIIAPASERPVIELAPAGDSVAAH